MSRALPYQLPFGIGHNHLNSGIGAQALGGWKISAIISAVTGTPFTVQTNGSNLNTPGTTQTGQLTGPYKVTHAVGSTNHWFDPTAFSTPTGCTGQAYPNCVNPGLGNTGRNQFRGHRLHSEQRLAVQELSHLARSLSRDPHRGLPTEQHAPVRQPDQQQLLHGGKLRTGHRHGRQRSGQRKRHRRRQIVAGVRSHLVLGRIDTFQAVST